MKAIEDQFSVQSACFSACRFHSPGALLEILFSVTSPEKSAWNCGTGNGHVAVEVGRK